MGVFHYIEYSAASLLEGLGEVDDVNFTLYLHYHREALYSDSNETVAQWIISVNALALCEEEDVRDCTASSWLIDRINFDGDDFEDGVLQQVLDEPMTVSDAVCDYVAMNDDGTHSASSTAVIVVVAVLIVAALCLV